MDSEAHSDSEARPARRERRRTIARWLLITLSVAVVAAVLITAAVLSRGSDPKPAAPAAQPAEATSTPSVEPTATVVVPGRLRIPRIGVDAPVVPVGIDADGVMESPAGRDEIGWLETAARPGAQGSAVMAGHSGYRTGSAVFDDLGDVKVGDAIYVLDASGAAVEFRVRELRLYERDERPEEVYGGGGEARLNLITCTGAWDEAAGTHEQRLVVFAEAAGRAE